MFSDDGGAGIKESEFVTAGVTTLDMTLLLLSGSVFAPLLLLTELAAIVDMVAVVGTLLILFDVVMLPGVDPNGSVD